MTTTTTKKTPQKPRKRRTSAPKAKAAKSPKSTKKREEPAPPPVTLAEVADGYLLYLESIGKSASTVFSYRMDLAIAKKHFGSETRIPDITPEEVEAFNNSPVVTKRRSGKPKAEITIKKTRRVLRMALEWIGARSGTPNKRVR